MHDRNAAVDPAWGCEPRAARGSTRGSQEETQKKKKKNKRRKKAKAPPETLTTTPSSPTWPRNFATASGMTRYPSKTWRAGWRKAKSSSASAATRRGSDVRAVNRAGGKARMVGSFVYPYNPGPEDWSRDDGGLLRRPVALLRRHVQGAGTRRQRQPLLRWTSGVQVSSRDGDDLPMTAASTRRNLSCRESTRRSWALPGLRGAKLLCKRHFLQPGRKGCRGYPEDLQVVGAGVPEGVARGRLVASARQLSTLQGGKTPALTGVRPAAFQIMIATSCCIPTGWEAL